MKIKKPNQNIPTGYSIKVRPKKVSHHHCADIFGAEVPLVSKRFENGPPTSAGYVYAVKGILCIEHLAMLPVDQCIKTNFPADKIVKLHLRNPLKPDSWWGKCPRRLTIGLTTLEYTKYMFQIGFARMFLVASMVAVALGVLSNPWLIAVGIAGFLFSSLMHACAPVWYLEVSKEFTSVKGVSREYLKQFDLIDKVDRHSFSFLAQTEADRFVN